MNALIKFVLTQRMLMLVLLVTTLVAGVFAFRALNIEAYPDPVPPMVEIVTQSTGQSAEEIERYITIPIETDMAGIPNVTSVRSISLFGLSDVKISFDYHFTHEQAQQWVINRLSQLSPLPNGAQPSISPTSPIGEIYRYQLVGPPGYSSRKLKTLQDWVLERRFKAVPGVVDVTGWGGKTKSYEVNVDLEKMHKYGLSLSQILQVIGNSNINVGGQTLNIGQQAVVVRGVGLLRSLDDLRDTMLTTSKGVPVLLGDVATVGVGNLPRLGIAGLDNQDDIVQGIVLMRRGGESMPTIERVEAEVAKINAQHILPPGVEIKRIYDRKGLIEITMHTVMESMIMGMLLIFVLQWVFLGNLRSAVIVAMTIPFALAFAVLLMVIRGESANLLSMGAIDFGLVVDASVIMVENIMRNLAESRHHRVAEESILHRVYTPVGLTGKFATIANAAIEVNKSILFSAVIIIAGFLPLFTMTGIVGHIFGPMATTYAYAIAGGLIATFTISPALSSILLPAHIEETETWLIRKLRRVYEPMIRWALAFKRLVLLLTFILLIVAVLLGRTLGLEFLPKLEEGNLWIRATMPQTISLEASDPYVNRMRRLIEHYPEVEHVVSQHGRPDDGTDATGFFNAEFFVPLKPFDQWPKGVNKEKLTSDMSAALTAEFPGVDFNFSQYIEDNVEEAASGVKGENSIKLFGNDLVVLEQYAEQIKQVLSTVPGMADLGVYTSLGQPTLRIDIDRAKAARYGLAPGDINTTIQAAIGGQSAGDLYEPGHDQHFPIMVRLAPKYRDNLAAIKRIGIPAPDPRGNGGTVEVPLADVATIRLTTGASFIYRENQERYIPIKFSVRGRDLGTTVLDAQAKLAQQVHLPQGYRMEWVGEFQNFQDAISRLAIVVPLSIALIGLLLFMNFRSFVDVLLAVSVIPMAMLGGIFALYLTGTPFSISAAIGFVALFGISAMDGILMLSYFNNQLDSGIERLEAIRKTCVVQFRPVMMTCIVASVGLVPAAFATGIGSQVQKPLALVVVGGMLLAPILILTVLPVLIVLFSRRKTVQQAV
ncbi:MAG TPA: CusA/CzcA family heavy metal efflux RND transporter [Halothiobacillus sp.]|nr:CusA/CzcA family heavy metal efflux RND transporter [Halothiobacillus sp.]